MKMYRSNTQSRQGIALVVVLGVLATLTILIVSLVIGMRVERIAADSYVESVRAKHLLQVALARAISDLNVELELDDNDPRFIPEWSVFPSSGAGGAYPDLLWASASNHIPVHLFGDVQLESGNVDWVLLNIPGGGEANRNVRYAYLIMDHSGALDINVAGGADRDTGTHSAEISIGMLDNEVTNTVAFVADRAARWVRFESMAELVELPIAGYTEAGGTHVYGRYPPDKWWDAGAEQWRDKIPIGGSVADLLGRQADIVAALEAADVPNAQDTFYNLLDYVDEDNWPKHPDPDTALNSFNTVRAPMINEIVVTSRVEVVEGVGEDPTRVRHTAEIIVEIWNPFNHSGTYQLAAAPDIDFETPVPAGAPPGAEAFYEDLNPGLVAPTHGDAAIIGSGEFELLRYRYVLPPVDFGSASEPLSFRMTVDINRIDLVREGGNQIVDRVGGMATFTIDGDSDGSLRDGKAVRDPRLNFDPDEWFPEHPPTLGAMNAITEQYYLTGQGEPLPDADNLLYVRNGPLESVAELGMLSYGKPWQRIALYDGVWTGGELHPVLNYFTITNEVRRGLININAGNTNLIAAGLTRAPIKADPEASPSGQLAAADAMAIAQEIVSAVDPDNYGIAVIGRSGRYASIPNHSKQEIDSIISNSYRLYGVRNNFFTIFLAVQVINDLELVVAEQKGMALVWRDPFPADDGDHPTFIRFFKQAMH